MPSYQISFTPTSLITLHHPSTSRRREHPALSAWRVILKTHWRALVCQSADLSSHGTEQWRIQDLPRGVTMASVRRRGDHGERAEREPKRGLGAEHPAASRSPWWGAKPPEAESFLYILYKKSGHKLRI